MLKLFKRKLNQLFIVVLFFAIFAPFVVSAKPNLGTNYVGNLGLTEANNTDPRAFAINIVKYLMTFLGIIAVLVVLYGGFIWMTAGGNEDKVDKAKKMIISGAIGLVIVLSAFAIITFVINVTGSALNGDAVNEW